MLLNASHMFIYNVRVLQLLIISGDFTIYCTMSLLCLPCKCVIYMETGHLFWALVKWRLRHQVGIPDKPVVDCSCWKLYNPGCLLQCYLKGGFTQKWILCLTDSSPPMVPHLVPFRGEAGTFPDFWETVLWGHPSEVCPLLLSLPLGHLESTAQFTPV